MAASILLRPYSIEVLKCSSNLLICSGVKDVELATLIPKGKGSPFDLEVYHSPKSRTL
jgi:hypothetical protein